jgi:hypothetical protein
VTLGDRQSFLREHIKSRLENTMPPFFTFVTAFYDSSIISGALPEGFSISISLRGYVQTRAQTNCEITTVKKWIPSALWTPVRGGLASDPEFRADVKRSEDPIDQWTQMIALRLQHITIRRPRARRAAALRSPSNGLAKARGASSSTGRLQYFTSPSADVRHVTIRRPRARRATAPRPPSNGRAKARVASPSTGRLHLAQTDFRCPRIGRLTSIRFRMRFGSNFRTVECSGSSSEDKNSSIEERIRDLIEDFSLFLPEQIRRRRTAKICDEEWQARPLQIQW